MGLNFPGGSFTLLVSDYPSASEVRTKLLLPFASLERKKMQLPRMSRCSGFMSVELICDTRLIF